MIAVASGREGRTMALGEARRRPALALALLLGAAMPALAG